MKRLAKILSFLLVAAAMSCVTAQAQNCGDWLKVKGWHGTYSLSGVGTTDGNGGKYTINQTSSADVNLTGNITQCTGVLVWGPGTDTNFNLSLTDTFVSPCPPNESSDVLVGTGGGVSNSFMSVDITNGRYSFFPIPQANWSQGVTDCNGQITNTHGANYPLYPIQLDFPPTFPLPNKVGTLTVTNFTFPGTAGFEGGSATVPFTLSFTLTPIDANGNDIVDDTCSETGGSSIGCQNQSLGEDVPVVGTGFFLHYEGDRASGRSGSNTIASNDARMIGGWTLNVHHIYDHASETLFMGNGGQRSMWQLGAPVSFNGNYLLTSDDGSEVYVVDGASGRHLQTVTPLSGTLKYQFAYDVAGNLVTVTDATGNVTTIQRDGLENAKAIVSPFSQTTTLSVDSNGFLKQVTDPAGRTDKFTNTSFGLITARTDPNGNGYTYAYDNQGRLTSDSDSVGGSVTVNRTDANSGYSVTTTTALGRATTFQVTTPPFPGEQFTNTWPNGLQATMTKTQQNGQLLENSTLPDGTSVSDTKGPDPRWGLQAPVPISGTTTLGNLSMIRSGSRTALLGVPGNPFSLTTQTDTENFNGRIYTSVFTSSNKTYVDTTPVKRTTTTVLDSLERVSSRQLGLLLPVQFAYDSRGRLSTITQGTRITNLAYDVKGFLSSVTDPLNLNTSFTRDADGRLLTTTLPDSRVINYAYDNNGNLSSVTPPGKPPHGFSYTAVDMLSAYTPPTVPGTGATTYSYDNDRDLTTVTRPDGATIHYSYDSAGRLSAATTPTGTTSYAYDTTTGNLASASIAGGESIAYGYNGPLPTSSTWTGTVTGSVSRAYDNNFWVVSQNLNGGNAVTFTHDKDGLLTKAGALVVKRDPKNGLVKGTTLGTVIDSRTYDTFGDLSGYKLKHQTTILDSVKFTRDADGRVTGNTESIAGKTNKYAYTYDAAGRLTGVGINGTNVSSYTYDSNSNRLSATTPSGTLNGTYDAQDRLLTYGNTSYTYTGNGELASQTVSSQTTSYSYDVYGSLIAASLPNGTSLAYITDAEHKRVGKKVNGVLQQGFLYDGNRVVAQLNGSNAIVSQFIYGTGATAPDSMVQGGVTYRVFSDQLGSPRLVVNASTGAIVEQIDYDEFGNVVKDTNPGFQPFGFAGGLYDQDTKLVRFGARDYNPGVGRWTAKDPILFDGGDTNLYGYVSNDPVNFLDPTGLQNYMLDPDVIKNKLAQKALKEAKKEIAPGARDEYKKLIKENEKSSKAVNTTCDSVKDVTKGINDGLTGKETPPNSSQPPAPTPKPSPFKRSPSTPMEY